MYKLLLQTDRWMERTKTICIPQKVETGFTKLHRCLVVLVKKMSDLINFLMQNTNLVSVLSKICPNFTGHVWQDWKIWQTLVGDILIYPQVHANLRLFLNFASLLLNEYITFCIWINWSYLISKCLHSL